MVYNRCTGWNLQILNIDTILPISTWNLKEIYFDNKIKKAFSHHSLDLMRHKEKISKERKCFGDARELRKGRSDLLIQGEEVQYKISQERIWCWLIIAFSHTSLDSLVSLWHLQGKGVWKDFSKKKYKKVDV